MAGFSVSSGHVAACGVALAAPILLAYFVLTSEPGNTIIKPTTAMLLLYTTLCIVGNSLTKPSVVVDDWDLNDFFDNFHFFKLFFVIGWTCFSVVSTCLLYFFKEAEGVIFFAVTIAYSWFSLTGSIFYVVGLAARSGFNDIRSLWGSLSLLGLGITLPGFLASITIAELHPRSIQIVTVGLGIFTFSHTVFSFVFMSHWTQLDTWQDYVSYWFFPILLLPGVVAISIYDLYDPSTLPQMFFLSENLSVWLSSRMSTLGHEMFNMHDTKGTHNTIEFGVSKLSTPGPLKADASPMSPSEEKSFDFV